MLETREHGDKMEPMGWRAEVESRALRPEVELGDHHAKAELETGRPKANPNHYVVPLKEEQRETEDN